ncbi:MAG TPA: ATP-binding cassette domain-containing protein [Candidatus Ozemobacteraceae bacterium]|nr:ATP-binding cassette domain-containing protein [Candidatus Ozemobacteraceae bacterium]
MIRFDQVSFRYGTDERTSPTIVGEVSFCIRPGECVGLVGNNGSGKSTIALLSKGMLIPSVGTVTVDGIDTRIQTDEQKTRVGLLFQNPDHQIVGTTIREDIAFGLENIGVESDKIEDRIQREADRLGLWAFLDQPIHALSGGTRQKAALAAVLAVQPGFLILDEPTSQLDPWARDTLWMHLNEIRSQAEVGLLVISQHLSDIELLDRVIVLAGGRILADDAPKNIIKSIKYAGPIDFSDPFSIFFRTGRNRRYSIPANSGASVIGDVRAGAIQVLEYSELSIGYPGTIVRKGLSGTFRAGGVNLIAGPSGSGKTTLLTTLAGFLPKIGGEINADHSPWVAEGRIGLAFQNPERLFFCETVGEEICFALLQKGIDSEVAAAEGRAWLEKWGLPSEEFWSRSPIKLSGGEMRRVALAACTVAAPEVMLLDEPLAGLDSAGRHSVSSIISELARDRIVIAVTHDPEDLLDQAAGVLLLHDDTGQWFESGDAFVKAVAHSPELFPLGIPEQREYQKNSGAPCASKNPGNAPSGYISGTGAPCGDTWLYRLHPEVKGCVAFGIIMALSLYTGNPVISLFWLLGSLVAAIYGRAPVGDAVRSLRQIWFLIVLVAFFNIVSGGKDSLVQAFDNIVRLSGVFIIATLYVAVSTQAELMAFWESCFRPLSLFGVNTREPALVMVIAVRFLPVMLEEIEQIRLAQRARGARFDTGWRGSVFSLLPLLVPTLTLALHRASVLAVAMESRGYRLSGHRTKYRVFRMSPADYGVLLSMVCAVLISFYFIRHMS